MSERLHGRMIYFLTGFMTLVVVAVIVIPAIVKSPAKPLHVALVGPAAQALAPLVQAEAAAAGLHLEIEDLPEGSDVPARLNQGTLDVAVTAGASVQATVQQTLDPALQAVLESAADRQHLETVISGAGVPPQTLQHALAPTPFSTTALKPPRPQQAARDGAAIAAAAFLYVALILYGSGVASGVAQEKTSRTAEVLLSAVTAQDLLVGKVLGIGACGLGQLGVTAIAGLIANAVVHQAHISSVIWGLLPGVLGWFLLGYALYSFAFAAAGSLVARQEDVQSVVGPFSVVLFASYLLVFAMAASPDAAWVQALSLLPPLSPVLMPARIAMGHVAPWQTVLAIALTLGAAAGVARLGARVYATALVHSGPRLKWREALHRNRAD